MAKSLFNQYGVGNDDDWAMSQEIFELIKPVVDEYLAKGFNHAEIENVINQEVRMWATGTRLRNVKYLKENQ